jgi:hypothetical protein
MTSDGVRVFVTPISATAEVVTLALAESLAGVVSVAAETETVVVSVVPPAIDAGTFETTVKVACAAGLIGADNEQVIVPFAPETGVLQFHPAGGVSATNVVGAGSGILTEAAVAVLGPRLVVTTVHVRLLPAITGFGLPATVTVKSVTGVTRTSTSNVLSFEFGSGVALVMLAVVLYVPEAVAGVDAVIVNVAEPGGSVAAVQLIVPPLPVEGAVHNHPAGMLSD